MSSLQSRLSDLISAVGADVKSLRENPTLKPTAVKTVNYTAANGEFVRMSGAHSTTLPTAVAGMTIGVLNYNGDAAQTVLTSGSAIFKGPGVPASATSIPLGTWNAYVVLVSDGTDWYITAGQTDTGWIAPNYNAYWASVNFAYRKIGNRVQFKGRVTVTNMSYAAQYPFNIPAGNRATAQGYAYVLAIVNGSVSPQYVSWYANGDLWVAAVGVGASCDYYLDAITFLTD